MSLLDTQMRYSYNDIMLMPSVATRVQHRSECDPYINGNLPIFAAPMSTVVDSENWLKFKENNIIPIIPRNISIETRLKLMINDNQWIAVSLNEFSELFAKPNEEWMGIEKKVLIDVANGHMLHIYDLVRISKSIYGDTITLMVGNVANPHSYELAREVGVDYLKVGIGGGSACITSSNTAIHMPMASLISETVQIKKEIEDQLSSKEEKEKLPKIIADGGIRNYSDVIKALALGADYVMIGGVLASLIESAAPIYDEVGNMVFNDDKNPIIEKEGKFYRVKDDRPISISHKVFYGMASKEGQLSIQGKKTKTSEGLCKKIQVTTNLHKWSENMRDYLRSSMSYNDSFTIGEFRNKTHPIVVSQNTKESVNK